MHKARLLVDSNTDLFYVDIDLSMYFQRLREMRAVDAARGVSHSEEAYHEWAVEECLANGNYSGILG